MYATAYLITSDYIMHKYIHRLSSDMGSHASRFELIKTWQIFLQHGFVGITLLYKHRSRYYLIFAFYLDEHKKENLKCVKYALVRPTMLCFLVHCFVFTST